VDGRAKRLAGNEKSGLRFRRPPAFSEFGLPWRCGRCRRLGFRLGTAAVHDDAGVVGVFPELCVRGGELRDARVHLVVQHGIGGGKLVGHLIGGGAAGSHGVARLADARGVGVNLRFQVGEFGGGNTSEAWGGGLDAP